MISFHELILLFKSLIRGFCLLTNQQIPPIDTIEKYGHAMFSKADINNDQLLEIGE